ncbi:MAG: DUF3179 domain-containing (seleno)protein [Halarchaeum sp.]
MARDTSDERLRELTDRLLVRDADAHADAVAELADRGDERVVPHLLEVLVIDGIANDWERFGFPEVLRSHSPPRYLELPEVRWPGVRDALAELAEPDFDSDHAWVEWESWYSQQEIRPLDGFDDWKLRLYKSYLPPVGGLLDCDPRDFDLQSIRWGNCDRSFLAALNAPDFVPGDAVDADGSGGDYERYLDDEDTVFGFVLDDTPYAVPRWVLFPHELMNAELGGVPVSLTYCTLCNAPILYDRRIKGELRTFGSTGMLRAGNKVMYDEETETLWDQHAGHPLGGPHLERDPDARLDQHTVTQTTWGEWRAEYPDTLALDKDTGYDYDYDHYDGELGIFRHYWENEDVVQPGVERDDDRLPEKAAVYGVPDGDDVWVVPADALDEDTVITGHVGDREIVALLDPTGDIAVYDAPPLPVERTPDGLRDADGTAWTVTRDALVADGDTRERVTGRHGLWFAFRTHYDTAHVLD